MLGMLPPISSSAKTISLSWMSTPLTRATTGSLSWARETPSGADRSMAQARTASARQSRRRLRAMEHDPSGQPIKTPYEGAVLLARTLAESYPLGNGRIGPPANEDVKDGSH